jgi:hypothetical protein
LIDVIGSSEIAAGAAPAHRPEIQASRFKSQVNSAKLLEANGM